MFALGMSGLLGCFFSILLPSTAPARCFLMETTGGKTQLCHLWTAAFTLFTMLVFANFMRDLPVCVLASIILASLVPLVKYFFDPARLYKTSKYDLLIWMVTFWASLFFSVQEGMVIGIGFSMILMHIWMLKEARGSVLGKHSNGLFLDREHYPRDEEDLKENPGLDWDMEEAVQQGYIFIYKFEAPIYFSTIEGFIRLLYSKIPSPTDLKKEKVYLEKIKKKMLRRRRSKRNKDKNTKESEKSTKESQTNQNLDMNLSYDESNDVFVTLNAPVSPLSDLDTDDELFHNDSKFTPSKLKCLILDFSAVSLIDTHAAKSIAFLHQEYGKCGVVVLISSCNNNVFKFFKKVSAI